MTDRSKKHYRDILSSTLKGDSHILPLVTTKKEFISDFWEYLQSSGDFPLDIINAKIKTLSICRVPFDKIGKLYNQTISGDFGKTHSYKVQNTPKWDNDLQKWVSNEETKYKTVWNYDSFNVDYYARHIFCVDRKFDNILKLNNINFSDIYDEIESFFVCGGAAILQEESKYNSQKAELLTDWLEDNHKDEQLITAKNSDLDHLKKKVDKEFLIRKLNGEFDCKTNIKVNLQEDTIRDETTIFFMPIGYIEYEYENQTYYFIETLFDKKIVIQQSAPKDYAYEYQKGGLIRGFLVLLYVIFGYFYFCLAMKINLPHIKSFLYFIYIIMFFNSIIMHQDAKELNEENKEKRLQHIKSVFVKNTELKDLILKLNRPYIKETVHE